MIVSYHHGVKRKPYPELRQLACGGIFPEMMIWQQEQFGILSRFMRNQKL